MKTRLLTSVNSLIAILLSVLGFSSCNNSNKEESILVEYGSPYATLEVSGKVTNEETNPLENIQVTVKHIERPGDEVPEVVYTLPSANTDVNGDYTVAENRVRPFNHIDIIVTDPADIYLPDSIRVKVDYDKSEVPADNHWNHGVGVVYQDFQLKKK